MFVFHSWLHRIPQEFSPASTYIQTVVFTLGIINSTAFSDMRLDHFINYDSLNIKGLRGIHIDTIKSSDIVPGSERTFVYHPHNYIKVYFFSKSTARLEYEIGNLGATVVFCWNCATKFGFFFWCWGAYKNTWCKIKQVVCFPGDFCLFQSWKIGSI